MASTRSEAAGGEIVTPPAFLLLLIGGQNPDVRERHFAACLGTGADESHAQVSRLVPQFIVARPPLAIDFHYHQVALEKQADQVGIVF